MEGGDKMKYIWNYRHDIKVNISTVKQFTVSEVYYGAKIIYEVRAWYNTNDYHTIDKFESITDAYDLIDTIAI